MATAQEQYVCKSCREIDFRPLLRALKPGSCYPEVEFCSTYDEDCAVCVLLYEPLPSGSLGSCVWSYPVANGYHVNGSIPGVEKSVVMKPYSSSKQRLFGVSTGGDFRYTVNEKWDPAIAQSWLQTCLQSHGPACTKRLSEVVDMALIDCDSMAIVEADGSSPWIALSYVWGDRHQSAAAQGLRLGSQLPDCIPRTIEDAITVTKRLGYRFLWVDEYCIDQRNEQRRSQQIERMDAIYRQADLTIVAAAGNDKTYGLPGVDKTKWKRLKTIDLTDITLFAILEPPDHTLEKIKWSTRAWTFQEGILSRRVLMFTDYQMSFHCAGDSWVEGLGEYLTQAEMIRFGQTPAILSLPGKHVTHSSPVDFKSYSDLVALYSRPQLTFERDTLNAFRGIMHDMRRLHSTAFNLCGLPFLVGPEEDTCEYWSSRLTNALYWSSCSHPATQKRRSMFPSWTWAGWHGHAKFPGPISDHVPLDLEPIIQGMRFGNQAGDTFDPRILFKQISHDKFQQTLDDVTEIYFDAPNIAARGLPADEHDYTSSIFSNDTSWVSLEYSDLIESKRDDPWSFLLMAVAHDGPFVHAMAVQWKEDGVSAERIGMLELRTKKNLKKEVAILNKIERRRVRLI